MNDRADDKPSAPADDDAADRAAMTRLQGGHDAALNELMERHAPRIYYYLVRSLQNEEDAADLAQETFIKVYQTRARFDPNQKFSTWLYAIASNLVRDRFRWRSRHPQISLQSAAESGADPLPETMAATRPSPPEAMQAEERAEAVRQAVAALPEELRIPLILAEYEERSQADIAAILGCSIKAVETRIYRARQKLRLSLQDFLR